MSDITHEPSEFWIAIRQFWQAQKVWLISAILFGLLFIFDRSQSAQRFSVA